MAKSVTKRLLETLKKIDRPGTFCASGLLPSTLPGLEVAGFGPVALPLDKRQVTQLKKQARQAPYGKGTRTLVDTNVRRVWEIDAEQVTLANSEWHDLLNGAVQTVQRELGLESQTLEAHLYKLLLYEKGSFFLPHRDGEKLDRMVGTLVIVLPTAHQGGELMVRHEGREVVVDFGEQSQFQTQFAAFYADCEHEIRPVTGGFRLALIYNLTVKKSGETISAPSRSKFITEAVTILREKPGQQMPRKLAVCLEHKYTQAGLAGDALKGVDQACAEVLFAAAKEAGWDAHLAIMTYWESGYVDEFLYESGYGSRSRGGYRSRQATPQEHVMEEVFDTSLTATDFKDADGSPLEFGTIRLEESEIVSNHPMDHGKPDLEDFEGYTGNAGMTLERWYHHAAVVLWPAESRFDLLCEAGVEASVGGLAHMVGQLKKAKGSERKRLQDSCLKFASRIIASWAKESQKANQYKAYDPRVKSDEVNPLLIQLQELGDASLVAKWIRYVMGQDVWVQPGKTLGDLCNAHGWNTFRKELLKLYDFTSYDTLARNSWLLADFSLREDDDDARKRLCRELADRTVAALENRSYDKDIPVWVTNRLDLNNLLLHLTQALLVIQEPKFSERLVKLILDRPNDFNVSKTIAPMLLKLAPWLKQNVKVASPEFYGLLKAVEKELLERKAKPPKEPTDWRREANLTCKCADCKTLASFMADPDAETLRLPLAAKRRGHLHNTINVKKLDLTHETERVGRPQTLVCTKTKDSYERALEAYQLDLDCLASIKKVILWYEGLPPDPERHQGQIRPINNRGKKNRQA